MENKEKKAKMLNVPNTLSLIRVVLVPFFIFSVLLESYAWADGIGVWGRIIPAVVFFLTAFTDMLDGKIARKYNLVTDFGKFIDPLADKFMVFGALLVMVMQYTYISEIFVWVAAVVMLRELGVTSLRLVVAGKSGIVVAASWFGKIKTVTQVASIELIILEPVILDLFGDWFARGYYPLSWFAMAAMLITTVASGIDYLKAYWPHINTNK